MINLRYHIVSLVAVFLALALGIVMGSTVIDKAIVDELRDRVDSVSDRAAKTDGENRTLRGQLDVMRGFADEARDQRHREEGQPRRQQVAKRRIGQCGERRFGGRQRKVLFSRDDGVDASAPRPARGRSVPARLTAVNRRAAESAGCGYGRPASGRYNFRFARTAACGIRASTSRR